ncbi:MAG: YicC family protein [Acidobacteriales bacterium]|nr:YicC family protein [Terriglobales bacterium]
MSVHSMTGFAQVRWQSGTQGFVLALKSVNHRYLDLQFRLPSDCDALEMKLRRLLKEKLIRGHVDVTFSLDRGASTEFQLNRELVKAYVAAFRAAATETGLTSEPDLNAVLKLPGALNSGVGAVDEAFESVAMAHAEECIAKLNEMRAEEGRGIEHELRRSMARLAASTDEVEQMRVAISRACLDKVHARMNELISGKADQDRILQEAAMLAERSDIEEEIVRLKAHIKHFIGLLSGSGEIGKKLDFLLQELNREANTMLSKTSGIAGDGLRITELGLAMKAEIEKAREQVQNIE